MKKIPKTGKKTKKEPACCPNSEVEQEKPQE
jgi:hypothetical protein